MGLGTILDRRGPQVHQSGQCVLRKNVHSRDALCQRAMSRSRTHRVRLSAFISSATRSDDKNRGEGDGPDRRRSHSLLRIAYNPRNTFVSHLTISVELLKESRQ